MSGVHTRLAHIALIVGVFLLGFGTLSVGPLSDPQPVQAGTAETMESQILGWINDARARKHLSPLTVGPKLTSLAGYRASTMARTGVMQHPSCLSCLFRSYDISFSKCAEVIAYTTYPWGTQAAQSIFNGWKNSSMHWSILMRSDLHRIGIGVAYRSSGHKTFAAAVLAN